MFVNVLNASYYKVLPKYEMSKSYWQKTASLKNISHHVYSSKQGHEFAQQSSTQTGNMNKRSLEDARGDRNNRCDHSILALESLSRIRYPLLCTSLPRGMPLPRAQVKPITLATKVLKVRYSFSTTPRRMVFISGIPEPRGKNYEGGYKEIWEHVKATWLKLITWAWISECISHPLPVVPVSVWSQQRRWWELLDRWPRPGIAAACYCADHHTSTSVLQTPAHTIKLHLCRPRLF